MEDAVHAVRQRPGGGGGQGFHPQDPQQGHGLVLPEQVGQDGHPHGDDRDLQWLAGVHQGLEIQPVHMLEQGGLPAVAQLHSGAALPHRHVAQPRRVDAEHGIRHRALGLRHGHQPTRQGGVEGHAAPADVHALTQVEQLDVALPGARRQGNRRALQVGPAPREWQARSSGGRQPLEVPGGLRLHLQTISESGHRPDSGNLGLQGAPLRTRRTAPKGHEGSAIALKGHPGQGPPVACDRPRGRRLERPFGGRSQPPPPWGCPGWGRLHSCPS